MGIDYISKIEIDLFDSSAKIIIGYWEQEPKGLRLAQLYKEIIIECSPESVAEIIFNRDKYTLEQALGYLMQKNA